MFRFTILLLLSCLFGCQRRDPSQVSPFQEEQTDFVLLVAVDLSGSFLEQMADDGKAYEFTLKAIDQYFRDRMGSDSQLVITQLSGNNLPLLWQGSPHHLRREFPTAKEFRDFLHDRADPGGSRINDGIAESIDYVLRTDGVNQGKTRVIALILSDMVDNHPDPTESDERLSQSLSRFAQHGEIGIYFCNQWRMPEVRAQLDQAGFRRYVLEPDFRGSPPLPSFD